jgi:hypothetical protein
MMGFAGNGGALAGTAGGKFGGSSFSLAFETAEVNVPVGEDEIVTLFATEGMLELVGPETGLPEVVGGFGLVAIRFF